MSGHRGPTPVDPDVVLISRYLISELSPDEAKAVKERLDNDAAFRGKVLPLVESWIGSPALGEAIDLLDAQGDKPRHVGPIGRDHRAARQAAWDRVTHHAGLRRSKVETGMVVGRERWWHRVADWPWWTQVAGIVALVLKLAGVSVTGVALVRGIEAAERRRVVAAIVSDSVAAQLRLTPPTGAEGVTRTIVLKDSSTVALASGGELNVLEPMTIVGRLTTPVHLRGDAVFEVKSWLVTVIAPTSTLGLRPGRYTIRATADETIVRVERGRATLKGGPFDKGVVVKDGQQARARSRERAALVSDSARISRP